MVKRLDDITFSKGNLQGIQKVVDIQHACCPKGCSLMNDKVKIRQMDSIEVKVKFKNQEGTIYLDPEFGSNKHFMDVDIPKDEIVDLFCPHCGISLKDENKTCQTCSAPMFTLEIPNEGVISACLRKGCFGHALQIESLDSMHLEFDDDFVRIIM